MLWYTALYLFQTVLGTRAIHPHYNIFFNDQPSFAGGGYPKHHPPQHPQFPPGGSNFGHNFVPRPPGRPSPTDPSGMGCGTVPNSCPISRYRTFDGTCNNLRNPVLGTPNSPYTRLLPTNYGDGISTPTVAISGNQLPSARVVSLRLYPDVLLEDPVFTVNAMQYGQIITHDMSMIAGSTQAQPHQTRCCSDDGQLLELANIPEHCFPIMVPDNDPIHSASNIKCMNFVRTITDRDRRCVGGSQPAEQLTVVNHFLDLSLVYGNTPEANRQLRLFQKGLLRVDIRRGQQWPPRSLNASGICNLQRMEDACYLTGDARANQNPQLTVLQIVYLREHNRIAQILCQLNPHWNDEILFQEARKINIAQHQHITYYEWLPVFLGDARANQNPQLTVLQIVYLREHNRIAQILCQLNPHWNDEILFQEARKINIAQHQHITYYEWLPVFLGEDNLIESEIIWQTHGFVNDYDDTVNPSILNEHATAAFRYFHSLIVGNLHLVTEGRVTRGTLRLSDWLNRPQILEEADNFDDLARGLNTQPQHASDQFHDSEITHFLFREEMPFGADLKALDVQRNRDHGLASYNDYRQFCGLPRASHFKDFLDVMISDNVRKLASLYERVNDVDLTVGGSLERHVPGTLVGPTFLCILKEQFYRTRVGDRFWFENSGETGFTLEQLYEIRKASISRLLCNNGRNIRAMQPKGFIQISVSNAVIPCEGLPAIDLSLWKEGTSGALINIPSDPYFKK